MSKTIHQDGLFVDTGLLRDHVSKLREQKKTASRLYETIAMMRSLSDPSTADQYRPILRDIDQLIEYLTRMSNVLDDAGDEAVRLSQALGGLILDDADYTHHVTDNTFML